MRGGMGGFHRIGGDWCYQGEHSGGNWVPREELECGGCASASVCAGGVELGGIWYGAHLLAANGVPLFYDGAAKW
jgi:hypothetical protein